MGNKKVKSTSATLNINVFVDCPYCDSQTDIMDGNYNEEGDVIKQACPEGVWSDEHENFLIKEVNCWNCEKNFDVEGLWW